MYPERDAITGKWIVFGTDGGVLYTHHSRGACAAWIDAQSQPPATAPVSGDQLLNDTVAHIANIWGPYELPRFGLNERVRHIPTDKKCLVKGYMGWTPPILLYSLEEVDGPQLPHLTPLSDIAHIAALAVGYEKGREAFAVDAPYDWLCRMCNKPNLASAKVCQCGVTPASGDCDRG